MNLRKTPQDRDSNTLIGHGTEMVTYRWTSIDDSTGQAITPPDDVKSCVIHVEGSTVVYTVTGGSDNSTEAQITSDGYSIADADIAATTSDTICTIKAPTGTTVNVSLIGWR